MKQMESNAISIDDDSDCSDNDDPDYKDSEHEDSKDRWRFCTARITPKMRNISDELSIMSFREDDDEENDGHVPVILNPLEYQQSQSMTQDQW